MINVSPYPQCAKKLQFQNCNLNDDKFTPFWAAVNVAFDVPDAQLTRFGGFDFSDRSERNGRKLLKRLEEFFSQRAQRYAGNSFAATEGLKSSLGARGIKTSMLKSEDDYWTAAETLFPGRIKRAEGITALYNQIHSIPKKERRRLAVENIGKVRKDWLSESVSA